VFAVNAPAGISCSIHDISGRVILQKRISAAGEKIDLSPMKNGLYIVKVFSFSQRVVQKLVIW
jgi:hypothetical protein